jgi:CBS domain-containing protein
MKANQIMTPEPEVVTPDQPVSRAAQIMRDSDVGSVPVVDDVKTKKLVGIITDRDIAVRHVADSHADDCAVSAHMTRDIETVTENDDAKAVLAAMKRREVRRIAVTDRGGSLVGMIAQADIAIADGILPQQVADVVETISQPAQPAR